MNSKPFVAALLLGGAAARRAALGLQARIRAEMSGAEDPRAGRHRRHRPGRAHSTRATWACAACRELPGRASGARGAAEKVVGLRVRSRIKANESILWSDLSAAGPRLARLAGMVQPGMRAVSVPATVASAFHGLLRLGDRVDLLLTTERSGSKDRVTFCCCRTCSYWRWATISASSDRALEGFESQTTVSVGVSAEQAQMLAFALDRVRSPCRCATRGHRESSRACRRPTRTTSCSRSRARASPSRSRSRPAADRARTPRVPTQADSSGWRSPRCSACLPCRTCSRRSRRWGLLAPAHPRHGAGAAGKEPEVLEPAAPVRRRAVRASNGLGEQTTVAAEACRSTRRPTT